MCLGNVYVSMEAYDQAIEAYNQVIACSPDEAYEAWYYLGLTY
ncbi:tetratricopeptide repeat protein [Eisenibacter elegans]|nr:tetratricopeptide repeat protein [Eisenibacter elegans]